MLKRGDTLEFYDIDIEKVNPANGTWVSYKETNLGTAKIIDSKNYTAIAEISSQISANAIKVDSAARIKDIPTREKFAYSDVETEYTDDEPEVIEVTPKYVEDDKELKAVTKPEEEVKPEKTVEKVAQKAEPKEEEPKLIEKNEAPASPEEKSTPETKVAETAPPKKEEVVPNSGNSSPIFPEPPTNFRAGMEFWSASGASSASSSFAPWIINHIEAETDLAVVPGLAYRPTVGLSFGKTGNGSYTGLNLDNFLFAPININNMIPSVTSIEAGAKVDVSTMGVNGETFGGMDEIGIGVLANLNGIFYFEELKHTFKYKAGLGYNFTGFGQAGVSGSSESLDKFREFTLTAEAISDIVIFNCNVGGQFKYNSKSIETASGETSISGFTLSATASMQL